MIRYICPHCNTQLESPDSMAGQVQACSSCNGAATVPQLGTALPPVQVGAGPYAGAAPGAAPLQNAPGAVASMVCGIVGLIVCGIIMGIIALILGAQAKGHISRTPGQYGGSGMATAGIVLGILDIVFAIIALIIIIGSRGVRT